MSDLVLFLENNKVALTYYGKNDIQNVTIDVPGSVAIDTQITDLTQLASTLNETLVGFEKYNPKSTNLRVIVPPSEVFLNFLTLNKEVNGGDEIEALVKLASERLEGISIEELYFDFQKLAPFVYQFIGVRKSYLESFLSLSNELQVSLVSVVPWILALTKNIPTNEPCILMYKTKSQYTVALAEFNGIYFLKDFDQTFDPSELSNLIKELSVYKRTNPIDKIYTINEIDLDLTSSNHVVEKYFDNQSDLDGMHEINVLVNKLLNETPGLNSTSLNLLSLLPMPVVEPANSKLVYVGAVTGALVLVLAGIFGYSQLSATSSQDSLAVAPENQQPSVLSENGTNEEEQETSNTPEENENQELNKEDITIRVENGAGIAGIAGRTQVLLEEKGFVVSSIGNAAETGRNNTLIQLKPSVAAYKSLLTEELSEDFDLEFTQDLSEDEEYDVLIVVGLN